MISISISCTIFSVLLNEQALMLLYQLSAGASYTIKLGSLSRSILVYFLSEAGKLLRVGDNISFIYPIATT